MASGTGFGNVQTPKKATPAAAKRKQAAKKYDNMKTEGVPEFNIYIRIQGKKTWYPAGSLAVNRINQINPAIFQEEENLRQGAFRLYPVLRKHQTELEYGYKLKGKEFADETIELAVRPQPITPNLFQSAINKVTDTFSTLLKRN